MTRCGSACHASLFTVVLVFKRECCFLPSFLSFNFVNFQVLFHGKTMQETKTDGRSHHSPVYSASLRLGRRCPGCRGLRELEHIKNQLTFCLIVNQGIVLYHTCHSLHLLVCPNFLWTANKMTSSVILDLCAVVLSSFSDMKSSGWPAESLFLLKHPEQGMAPK